ncbi:hypothetical protein ACLKA6_001159 [Drosophila palustris]
MSNLNKTPQMIEKEKEMESNHAFAKSSKLARSPPAQQPVSTATRACSTKAPETQSSAALLDLGREIANLVEMLDDGKRRSIHQPMRDSIESIRVLYELAAIQLHDDGAKAAIRTHQSCQTSPLFRTALETKRKQGTGRRVWFNWNHPMENRRPRPQLEVPNGGRLLRKRKPRKPKGALSTKVRPDALVIKTVGEVTYADLLRKVKQDEKLHGLGEAVSRIRRTQQIQQQEQQRKRSLKPSGKPLDFNVRPHRLCMRHRLLRPSCSRISSTSTAQQQAKTRSPRNGQEAF